MARQTTRQPQRLDNPPPLADDPGGLKNQKSPNKRERGGVQNRASNETAGQERPLVRLTGVSKRYGSVLAVKEQDLDIRRRDFLAILGPSGCGKTTLLRMIGGFVAPTSGRIEIDGQDVTALSPEKRPTNTVFQGYGLFPHMSVRQNIAYGLKTAKRPKDEIVRRVEEAIALVRLQDFVNRGIEQLSGGQQQRVALARALIMRPQVLLLDEPLAALDLKLRQAMQDELRRIHSEIGGTFVFVTHDQGEALGLASRIAVMDQGAIVQQGTPEEIYAAPKTRFVSTFIGEANVFAGRRAGGVIRLDAGASIPSAGPDGAVTVVVRPEAMRLGPDMVGAIAIDGVLADAIYLGSFVKYVVKLGDGQRVTLHSGDIASRRSVSIGQPVRIGWSASDQRVLEE